MIRRYSLLAVLATTVSFAYGQPASPGGQPPATNAPGTNVYVVSGFYGTGIYSVPSGGMVPPPGTVGMSLANQTGISMNTPIETGLQSTLGPRPVIYGSPAYYGTPAYPPPYSGEAVAESPGRPIHDMAPSYPGGAPGSAAPPMSLGEVAAQYKTNQSPASARTYTNADAERLGNRIMIAGTSVTVNAAPVVPVTPVETARAEPTQQPVTPTESQTATIAPPVAPQQPPPEQPAERQSIDQLPATSSFLPLLGLLGLLSGGIGMVVRKLSK